MATVVSTPVLAYVVAPIGGSAMGQSVNATIPITVPGWEARVPFRADQGNTANISAGPEFYAYRSTDGGATYETIASVGISITRNPNGTDRKALTLSTGYWLLRVITGGNGGSFGTTSFQIGTIENITAVQNV